MRLLPVIGVLLGLGWFFSSLAEEVIGEFHRFIQRFKGERLIGWMYAGRSTRVLILSKSRRNGCSGLVLNARFLSRSELGRCSSLFGFPASRKKESLIGLSFPLAEPCMIF